jgi:hypothetical protein
MSARLVKLMIEKGLVPQTAVQEMTRKGMIPPELAPLYSSKPLAADPSEEEVADFVAEIEDALLGEEPEVLLDFPKDNTVVVSCREAITVGWVSGNKLYVPKIQEGLLPKVVGVRSQFDGTGTEPFEVRTSDRRLVEFEGRVFLEITMPGDLVWAEKE